MEIKKEMMKILGDTKLPPEIHKMLRKIYTEYQNACRKLIQELKSKYPEKEKEITKLETEISQDYYEDVKMCEFIEFEEYDQKRTIVIEVINSIIKDSNANNIISRKKFVQDVSKIVKKEESIDFANIVINSMVQEIETSCKYVLNRISFLKLNDKIITEKKDQFKNEILKIKQEAIQKKPEIAQCINEHFIDICKRIENVIDTYERQSNLHIDRRKDDDEER
ncbi:MAG: hypothetical protein HFJ41_04685 [Clostridia bacterium]|nr:hypothetical protein [Clostridia bacterium]